MAKKFNAEFAEQVRAEKYREASEKIAELEQKWFDESEQRDKWKLC